MKAILRAVGSVFEATSKNGTTYGVKCLPAPLENRDCYKICKDKVCIYSGGCHAVLCLGEERPDKMHVWFKKIYVIKDNKKLMLDDNGNVKGTEQIYSHKICCHCKSHHDLEAVVCKHEPCRFSNYPLFKTPKTKQKQWKTY